MTFQEIEALRQKANISVHKMCRTAGVGIHIYYRTRLGKTQPSPRTLERWRQALAGKPSAPRRSGVNPELLRATYRAYLAMLARETGFDPAIALASEPSLRANASAEWAQAARLRAIAVYCVVVEHNVAAATVATAIGVTKQGTSQMCRRVEEFRDDPEIDALVERVGRLISGRP